MVNSGKVGVKHQSEAEMAAFLARKSGPAARESFMNHISSCDECLKATVSAFEAVESFRSENNNRDRRPKMKKTSIYLILSILAFLLSFVLPRYFIQLIAAAVICALKWITDSKSARMLVMINEAWKTGGPAGAPDIANRLNRDKCERR